MEAADECGLLPMYIDIVQKRLIGKMTHQQIADEQAKLPRRRIGGHDTTATLPSFVRRRELRTIQQIVYYLVLGRPFKGAYEMDDLE